jgi:hypothetical protein
MESIVKFEFALEKHHKKLKSKASGFYFPMDKKYEMDDEEAFDDYQTNLILHNARLYNTEEKKTFNANMQDIINLRTEFFSGTSEPHTKEKLHVITDEDDEMLVDVLDKYNKIIFYNEEQKMKLGKQNIITKTKSATDFTKNDLDEHFSNISPLLTYSQKKNKKLINPVQGQNPKNDLITQLSRIDSFSLPRSASKIKMYKFEHEKK